MICVSCSEDKDVEEFAPAPRNKNGRRGQCRACVRAYKNEWGRRNRRKVRHYAMKTEFGITHEDYDAMLDAQGGGCAICGATSCPSGRLAVDHDHATGEVRGLLCGNCNRGVGNLRDDPTLLRRAADYIELPSLLPKRPRS